MSDSTAVTSEATPEVTKETTRHLEPREWKLRVAPLSDDSVEARLAGETGLEPVTLRVCLARGLDSAQKIGDHLSPRIEKLTNPLLIRDMEKATARMSEARARGELVRVFGDYDVDGTTGAALLTWVLRDFGFRMEARQPDRFKDGYGLNVGAVEEASRAGAKVLVTVDCGISSYDAAAKARELGIDLIVIDHHQIDPARGLPQAYAILNPQREDCPSGLKELCGCGLAFYFSLALRARGRADGWFKDGAEPNLKQHLDLVVMATAADMVPLTGDNHVLVRHGMETLRGSRKPGVRALLTEAGVATREISPGHLGFVIGPRINASGRMASASLALELLTTSDAERARGLAAELERLNHERAELQNAIWDQVRARVEEGLKNGRFRHGIVVADRAWHEGVVGIVASRVTETFRRPAAVIALREDLGKGSVRSYAGKDVLGALRECAPKLLGFGGHKHAAGLTVALDGVEEFAAAFDEALSRVAEERESAPLLVEGGCGLADLNSKALEELERLGPFGPGNPEPVFVVEAAIRDHQILKGRHLKLRLSAAAVSESSGAEPHSTMEAIWFHAAETHGHVVAEPHRRGALWAGVPELNRFRGNVVPTLRVRDWRPLSDAAKLLPALVLGLVFSTLFFSACKPAGAADPASAPPSPAITASSPSYRLTVGGPAPAPSMTPLKMSPAEMRQLLSAFSKAQRTEVKALYHRQDLEYREFRSSQKARLEEWKASMNSAREKFFADHPDAQQRRGFMRDRDSKYQAFLKSLDDERAQHDLDAKAQLKALQRTQADRLKQFKSYLSRGERPPPELWPSPGG